jgi:MFS transporter, Spinster family, sphingosine-1-phosphate transporter
MQQTYKNYALALLMLILALGYVDRMVFGVALQSIKMDLQLTDTQLGLVNGLAFALFFSVMGIPIARWADRGDRVAIIALSTGIWGIAVATCSMASGFAHLLLIRIGVAIGDTGAGPPANSLIPDYCSRAERPRAVARYMLGVPIGVVIGYLAGGWLSEMYGWRTTFVVIGVPGLVLAVLAAFTLTEPRRVEGNIRARTPTNSQHALDSSFKDVLSTLMASRAFRHLLLYFCIWYFSGWAFGQWKAAFFMRSHQLGAAEVGTWLAFIHGGAGLLGTWLGGEWATRYAPQKERKQILAAAGFALFQLVSMGALLAPTHYWAFGWLAIGMLGGAMANGPVFATIQTLVPAHMRATALALISVLPGIVGMGLGPFAAGALSDALQPWAGTESLRFALLAFSPGYLWAAWHLYRASHFVEREIAIVLTNSHDVSHDANALPTKGTAFEAAGDERPLSSRT